MCKYSINPNSFDIDEIPEEKLFTFNILRDVLFPHNFLTQSDFLKKFVGYIIQIDVVKDDLDRASEQIKECSGIFTGRRHRARSCKAIIAEIDETEADIISSFAKNTMDFFEKNNKILETSNIQKKLLGYVQNKNNIVFVFNYDSSDSFKAFKGQNDVIFREYTSTLLSTNFYKGVVWLIIQAYLGPVGFNRLMGFIPGEREIIPPRSPNYLHTAKFCPSINVSDIDTLLSPRITVNNNTFLQSDFVEMFLDIDNTDRHLLILKSDTGAGKTYSLSNFFYSIQSNDSSLLPIFLSARDMKNKRILPSKALARQQNMDYETVSTNTLVSTTKNSPVILLIDGLDEIVGSSFRDNLLSDIWDLLSCNCQIHNLFIIISTRYWDNSCTDILEKIPQINASLEPLNLTDILKQKYNTLDFSDIKIPSFLQTTSPLIIACCLELIDDNNVSNDFTNILSGFNSKYFFWEKYFAHIFDGRKPISVHRTKVLAIASYARNIKKNIALEGSFFTKLGDTEMELQRYYPDMFPELIIQGDTNFLKALLESRIVNAKEVDSYLYYYFRHNECLDYLASAFLVIRIKKHIDNHSGKSINYITELLDSLCNPIDSEVYQNINYASFCFHGLKHLFDENNTCDNVKLKYVLFRLGLAISMHTEFERDISGILQPLIIKYLMNTPSSEADLPLLMAIQAFTYNMLAQSQYSEDFLESAKIMLNACQGILCDMQLLVELGNKITYDETFARKFKHLNEYYMIEPMAAIKYSLAAVVSIQGGINQQYARNGKTEVAKIEHINSAIESHTIAMKLKKEVMEISGKKFSLVRSYISLGSDHYYKSLYGNQREKESELNEAIVCYNNAIKETIAFELNSFDERTSPVSIYKNRAGALYQLFLLKSGTDNISCIKLHEYLQEISENVFKCIQEIQKYYSNNNDSLIGITKECEQLAKDIEIKYNNSVFNQYGAISAENKERLTLRLNELHELLEEDGKGN